MVRTETIIKKTAVAALFSAAAFAFAQEKQNVSGTVVSTDGKVIPYASVTFINKANKLFSDAALTDDNGNFSLQLVPGNYQIDIEGIDFKKYSVNKQITGGNIGNFTLHPEGGSATNTHTKNIEAVVITATSKPVKVDIDKKTYHVKSDITSIGGNLQDVLQNVPSVTVDPDGTVSMRGNSNVKFLVNGKPSALLGIDDGANALQAIPADQIERIEVITNPSAKFDAAGTAGILNIILKKSSKMGFNGSVIGTLGYLPKTALNANLNWKKGNWTWFVNGGGGYQESKGKNWSDTNYSTFPKYPDNAGSLLLQRSYQNSGGKNYMKNYNGTAGLVYDISEKTSINASLTVRSFNIENDSPVNYTDYLTNGQIISGFRNSNGTNKNIGGQADFGLDQKIGDKGQNISFALSLQKNDSDADNFIDQNYRSKVLQDITHQENNSKSLVGKIDYELPLGETSTFNAGYKVDNNKNDYVFNVSRKKFGEADFSTLGVEGYNNTTNYREFINALYAQFRSKIGDFGYQVGLRDEITNINLDYINLSGKDNIKDKKKNYNDFFPSVFLSYDLAKGNQLLLNYSRRIDRPRSFFLVPYMSFSDSQNIFRGNPDLNPAYIDSFEFGYNLSKKKFTLNPTIYLRKENDDVKMTLTYNKAEGKFYRQPMNLGYDQRVGLDLNFTYDPFSWLKMMGSADLYKYKTSGYYQDPSGLSDAVSYDGSGFSTRLRLGTTFKIDKTFSIQLQGNYRGRQVEGANDQKATYFVNAGATKSIWNGDGVISFNMQDVFNTRGRHVLQSGNGYSQEVYMQWQPQQATLSFTYRFKQGEKVEAPKRKKEVNTANEEGGGEQVPL